VKVLKMLESLVRVLGLSTALLLAVILSFANAARDCAPHESVLFLPLDERFTTRDAFLNLAATTPFCIRTPPTDLLPLWKYDCDIQQLHDWVDENIGYVNTAIISSEMYLYGGLIRSRTSNDSTAVIQARLDKLRSYSARRSDLSLYISNVVMRIPAYNGDFEEPWYWETNGYNIFSYSFYSDKYNQLGNPLDHITSEKYKSLVPSDALDEFTWRRERNHNITVNMINAAGGTSSEFKYLYITLDDNAQYGFNIREAEELRTLVGQLNVSASIPIYPGADEVQLTLLSKFSASKYGATIRTPVVTGIPVLAVVFRVPEAVNYIPNYEGQPMIDTLMQQIAAAGAAAVVVSTPDDAQLIGANAVLLVNNFENEKQGEAQSQPTSGTTDAYKVFDSYIQKALSASLPIGFCDNRYSNGADILFVQYMQDQMSSMSMKNLAYAGWNTDGNTIGTVVSNTVLLALFSANDASTGIVRANQVFNSLRVLEDKDYQSIYRQTLSDYANALDSEEENSSCFTPDLEFYERYSFKLLNAKYNELVQAYNLDLKLASVYYPWNRTFEIGLLV
jgi:hypothetical protein